MKLNLACGKRHMQGWVNVDLNVEADQTVDLNVFPWPWPDDSADEIAMFSYLWIADDLMATVIEAHRVLKHGGQLWVEVPHARGIKAYSPIARHRFTHWTFRNICRRQDFIGQSGWPQLQMFEMAHYRVKILAPFVQGYWTPLDWVASRFAELWERFVPLPPTYIEWKGTAIKTQATARRGSD